MNEKKSYEVKESKSKRVHFSKENWYRFGALVMAALMLLGTVAGVLIFILN